jgi:H+/Cl- antiporter ClcA
VALVEISGVVAEELHGVAAFDQREALWDQAFEFDRADFRAVLLLLAALLGALVVVEFAPDAVGSAMKQVDGRSRTISESSTSNLSRGGTGRRSSC